MSCCAMSRASSGVPPRGGLFKLPLCVGEFGWGYRSCSSSPAPLCRACHHTQIHRSSRHHLARVLRCVSLAWFRCAHRACCCWHSSNAPTTTHAQTDFKLVAAELSQLRSSTDRAQKAKEVAEKDRDKAVLAQRLLKREISELKEQLDAKDGESQVRGSVF